MARDLARLRLVFIFAHAWFGPGFQAGWQGVWNANCRFESEYLLINWRKKAKKPDNSFAGRLQSKCRNFFTAEAGILPKYSNLSKLTLPIDLKLPG
jgi:hypothetical protein